MPPYLYIGRQPFRYSGMSSSKCQKLQRILPGSHVRSESQAVIPRPHPERLLLGLKRTLPLESPRPSAGHGRRRRSSPCSITVPAPPRPSWFRRSQVRGRNYRGRFAPHRSLIPDLDIFRAAQVLVKQYGEDAPLHAAMRADAMMEMGDLDGYAVRKRALSSSTG